MHMKKKAISALFTSLYSTSMFMKIQETQWIRDFWFIYALRTQREDNI